MYSAIYEFSHSENGLATYSLDKAGNTRYEEFKYGISASLNSQWARNICPKLQSYLKFHYNTEKFASDFSYQDKILSKWKTMKKLFC